MVSRHVLVTGGGGGIGLAIARDLADQGLRVSLVGRDIVRLRAAAKDLGARFVACDVTDPDQVSAAVAKLRKDAGPIDILVNNAGVVRTAPFRRQSAEDWETMWRTNVMGAVNTIGEVLGDMRRCGWGRIVNIASTASLKPYPYASAYVATKHALLGLTRSLALELASTGVTVNAVCPGYADTDIIRTAVDQIVSRTGRSAEVARDVFTTANPQGRLIDPGEVGRAVRWLVEEDAGSITGQALVVAGGEVM